MHPYTIHRIDDLIEELDKIRKSQGHNMIAMDTDAVFTKMFTDGSSFLSEDDFIEVPEAEKEGFKPIMYIGKPKNWTYG